MPVTATASTRLRSRKSRAAFPEWVEPERQTASPFIPDGMISLFPPPGAANQPATPFTESGGTLSASRRLEQRRLRADFGHSRGRDGTARFDQSGDLSRNRQRANDRRHRRRVAVRTSRPSLALAADPTPKARAAWRFVGSAGPAYVRCKGLKLRNHSVVTPDRGKISLFGTTGMDYRFAGGGHSGSSSLRVRVARGAASNKQIVRMLSPCVDLERGRWFTR
jgi:hypothetical protein